jgi:AcrR family transcriptional regulator
VATSTDSAASPPLGLRERSKAKRRVLIVQTAMRLFAEQGYAGTTVADIADAAELAPRTIAGYFPTKIDIATAYADDIAARLTSTFHAHPDAGLLDILDIWLTAEADHLEPETAHLAVAMYRANPGLAALGRGHLATAASVFTNAIAAHLGVPDEHPTATITMSAFAAALGTYITAIAEHGPNPELHEWLMNLLRAMLGTASGMNHHAKPTRTSTPGPT